uniref:RIPOR family member 3 n=1 Tax=Gasterosteus aculeatus aculeatus TaxID=481459 RepID=G3N431_GASAC
MSVKLRFDSPSDGRLVHRSRSFTGVSSLTGRQRPCVRNSLHFKATTGGKSPRMHLSAGTGVGAIWSLQPEQVDRVFKALRKGLKEHLEGHQAEMDFLSSQQRTTRRNSRLAFLYDLEKEIRTKERYIRRLEFQISKVEELYETYWVQWRLYEGAGNMKRAFSRSPSSRASRDSLLELSRSQRLSVQEMSVMEEESEILLGELRIKMKGLIGFARLCPGDQYEVAVRLGQRRWRIRGRIQSDNTQAWDEEEVVFLPHIRHNFEIKVTEAKGLGWLLVGMVTCASTEFFVARPQLMMVDVTELGTIKLQLEVTWNPFDSEKMKPLVVQQEDFASQLDGTEYAVLKPRVLHIDDEGAAGRTWFSPISGEQMSTNERRGVSDQIPIPPGPPSSERLQSQLPLQPQCGREPEPAFPPGCLGGGGGEGEEEEEGEGRGGVGECVRSSLCGSRESNGFTTECCDPAPQQLPTQPVAVSPSSPEVSPSSRRAQAMRLGALMEELEKMLRDQRRSEKELLCLDHQVLHLATILKNNLSLLRVSEEEEETLAVEEVLGSFDFLSHDDDTSCSGSLRMKDSSPMRIQSATDEDSAVAPLTSGNWSLDQALEIHLKTCCVLLQMLAETDFSPSRKELLQEVSLQAEVLQKISCILLEEDRGVSAGDILPREVLAFWDDCVTGVGPSPFCCDSARFCRTLKKRFTHKVEAKEPGQSDKVFSHLLQELQASSRLVPSPPACSPEAVTLFQLFVYLRRWNLQDLGGHISRLSREEYILSALRSPKKRRALNKLRGGNFTVLLPLRCTLQTLAALQLDFNHKVCKAAASCMCRAAGCRAFRSQAIVYYTASLRNSDVLIQHGSCLALKCLKATESADLIADLWRSADEDLCCTARETVLSFGKKGYLAFQRMDQMYTEMLEEAYQNQETESTFL